MSDLEDESLGIKEKRGTTLKVLAILSWISLGLNAIGLFFTLVSGPATPEEMEEQIVALNQVITPELLEVLGQAYYDDTITILKVSNDLFYSLNGINASILILGFYSVFSMYNLKKRGFYTYLVYAFAPIVVSLAFFGAGSYIVIGAVFTAVISVTFCILYGVQTKRMS